MGESIHTARWINQIADQGWEIHLFPSQDWGVVHNDLQNVTIHHSIFAPQPNLPHSVKQRGLPVWTPILKDKTYVVRRRVSSFVKTFVAETWKRYRVRQLQRLIKRLKPDIIHTIEFQHGAYLALDVYDSMATFPTWVATNWGSDLYLFGRLSEHQHRIQRILQNCDFYSSECERDVQLARDMGFRGTALPVFPNAGGIEPMHTTEPPSSRRTILVKGYQHFAGRALFALRAIANCADVLSGYDIKLYSAFPDVRIAAELIAQDTGLNIECLDAISHDEMLHHYCQSRIYLGLSISDAISTSLLEAMATGAFPIQSNTACTDEWITHGETGLVVPPEDLTAIEAALRRAVEDDSLVDQAANHQSTNDS